MKNPYKKPPIGYEYEECCDNWIENNIIKREAEAMTKKLKRVKLFHQPWICEGWIAGPVNLAHLKNDILEYVVKTNPQTLKPRRIRITLQEIEVPQEFKPCDKCERVVCVC